MALMSQGGSSVRALMALSSLLHSVILLVHPCSLGHPIAREPSFECQHQVSGISFPCLLTELTGKAYALPRPPSPRASGSPTPHFVGQHCYTRKLLRALTTLCSRSAPQHVNSTWKRSPQSPPDPQSALRPWGQLPVELVPNAGFSVLPRGAVSQHQDHVDSAHSQPLLSAFREGACKYQVP